MKSGADAILFFLAMGLFVIGVYESMVRGISESYWIFMISLSLLFLYGYRKNQHPDKEEVKKRPVSKKATRKKK